MKALILNSGLGSRMGEMTKSQPKCMTVLGNGETIVGRQLRMLAAKGVTEVVMTTGPFADILKEHCESLDLPVHINFVSNPIYNSTNYIYSIYCAREFLQDDLMLVHGDLVFEDKVLEDILSSESSCVVVSSSLRLPEKDFKAVIQEGNVYKVGIEFFDNAVAAQPIYKLKWSDWNVWLNEIVRFCEMGQTSCYAENAFNEVSSRCSITPLDVKEHLCKEVDNLDDLCEVTKCLQEQKSVYMCFSTDLVHGGHIQIIKKAQELGSLMVGVLSDEAVASYKRFPVLPYEERKTLFENISGIDSVVEQKTLSYAENIRKYRPDYVVHGDDWREGTQKLIRDEVIETLRSYGGELVEFPYSHDEKYRELDERMRREASMPDMRRGKLRKLIEMKGQVSVIEAHDGLTGLIAETTVVQKDGGIKQFDAMWISSLCDSTSRGKPDIELVDMTDRYRTVNEIMEVTTKPIIFDGDTGGLKEHFAYNVRSLERMGVSMIIIEDKTGLKKNSLFGTEVEQTQENIEDFCEKIRFGKQAQITKEFMICARIESLILEKGMEDALKRAFAFSNAGADAIMIHSRKKDPAEIFEFARCFREYNKTTPLVVVPTSFNDVHEEEFKERGINIVIYANQLLRAGFPAMKKVATSILENSRAKECDDECLPFKDIIRLIPEKW